MSWRERRRSNLYHSLSGDAIKLPISLHMKQDLVRKILLKVADGENRCCYWGNTEENECVAGDRECAADS